MPLVWVMSGDFLIFVLEMEGVNSLMLIYNIKLKILYI